MTRMREKNVLHLLLPMLILLAALFLSTTAFAAAGITDARKAKTKVDLNGDGKKDTISVIQPSEDNGYAGRLLINGKKLYEFPEKRFSWMCSYRVITPKNGSRFILLSAQGANPGISDDVLLQYTAKKKIKKIISLREATEIFGGGSLISRVISTGGITVSGNTVTINYEKMLWTTGAITIRFRFSYKDGTLKRKSYKDAVVSSKKGLITAKKIQTYKKPKSEKKSVKFAKNTAVYLKNYYLKGNQMWLQLTDEAGEKGGWIKCLTKNPGGGKSPLFTNGYYSG